MERQTIAANFWVAPSKVRKNGLAPINATITRNGQRASFSTGRMIQPDTWDCKRQRAKASDITRWFDTKESFPKINGKSVAHLSIIRDKFFVK